MNGNRQCFLCGRNDSKDPLDRHHCFGGALKRKSEKYGLLVDLCHHDCHIFGAEAVHNNKENRLKVQRWAQRKAMREQGWNTDDFIREFGRNYLEEET